MSDIALPEPTMTAESAKALREPFPPEHVGLLPRVTCKDCSDRRKQCQKHQRQKCNECGAYVSPAHIHLDYVGHGAVTDRLNSVDPAWNWEPVAWDQTGLPLFAYNNDLEPVSLWIRLTVCGVTRLGVGSCPDGQFDAEKVLIGDALRNAAMRFGVALDLWIKGHAEDSERQSNLRSSTPSDRPEPVSRFVAPSGEVIDLWPGEVSAPDAKARVVEAAGNDRATAAKAWRAAELDGRVKVTEAELEAALAKISQGTEPTSNGVRESVTEPSPDPAGSADDKPIDARRFATKATSVFEATADPDKIPRGRKTWLMEALRHALLFAVSEGEVTSAKDADASLLYVAWGLLDDIEAGRVTFEFNTSPTQGVTFTWLDGNAGTTSVKWSELTIAEAEAEVDRRAGSA